MRLTPRLRDGRRALRAATLGALALGLAGCLSDPAAPRDAARVAVRTAIHGRFQTTAATRLHVEISYYPGGDQGSVDLVNADFPVDGTSDTRTLAVDILPCIASRSLPATAGAGPHAAAVPALALAPGAGTARQTTDTGSAEPGCYANIYVQLVSGDQILDSRYTYAFLRLGKTTETEPIALFAGTNPPTVTIPDNVAISVDPNLVRFAVQGRDVDGNLQAFSAVVEDSFSTQISSFSVSLGEPRDSVDGFLYGFVPQPTFSQGFNPHVVLQAFDTKGQSSAETTVRLSLPIGGASTARNVSYTIAGANTTITFDIDNLNENNAFVEVLFRDTNASSYESGLLAPVCRRAITGGGSMSVTCPSPAAASGLIQAIVIPVDANGNAGYAGRSPLPG